MEQVIGYLMNELHGCYKNKAAYEKKNNTLLINAISKRIEHFEKAISILENEETGISRLFEQRIYHFKKIDPAKNYSDFTFHNLSWNEINVGYCNRGEVIRIEDDYFVYAGSYSYHFSEQKPSIIRFKDRNKVIKEVPALTGEELDIKSN